LLDIFKRIYRFYDKNIDYYASSLSFFTIFAFTPIFIVILYVFSKVGLLDELHIYSLVLFQTILPKHMYLQEYVNNFFNFDLSIGIISVIYVLVTVFLFLKDYNSIVIKVLDIKPSRMSIFLFYVSHTIIIPIFILFYFFIYKYFDISFLYSPFFYFLFFIFYFFATLPSSMNKKNLFLILKVSIFMGILWEIIKNLYFIYTVYNKAYYTLYGSLSSIFFLFLWVYISWIIFLYGLKYYKEHQV